MDDEELEEMFAAKTPMREMAAQFGRSSGGITARLEKLGLIPSRHFYRPKATGES